MPYVPKDSENSREKFDVARSRRGCHMCHSSTVDDSQSGRGYRTCPDSKGIRVWAPCWRHVTRDETTNKWMSYAHRAKFK